MRYINFPLTFMESRNQLLLGRGMLWLWVCLAGRTLLDSDFHKQ